MQSTKIVQMHGLNKKLKRLKQGVTLYVVYAFPDRDTPEGFIEKRVLCSRPQIAISGWKYHFINYITFDNYEKMYRPSACSLKDMGLLPNRYNNHRTFFTEKSAKRYLELVLSGCDVNRKVLYNYLR